MIDSHPLDQECLEASKPKDQIDLRAGVDYLHAVETIKCCLGGSVPTAGEALYLVELEFDRALRIVFPLEDVDNEQI